MKRMTLVPCAQRIMIIDGAMGTVIQQYKLEEPDFRCSETFLGDEKWTTGDALPAGHSSENCGKFSWACPGSAPSAVCELCAEQAN